MVFRRDNKVESFQRQISALRQQLGTEGDDADLDQDEGAVRSYDDRERDRYGDGGSGSYGYGGPTTSAITPVEPPPLPAIPSVDAQSTVIAHDATWKGEIDSKGTVHVNGRFEGAIRAGDSVYIAEEADVDATVSAANVVIAGLVKGSVRASARFEVLPSGRVNADILAPSLVIHEGATINGQFRMGSGEATEAAAPTPVVGRRAARGTA